MKWFTKEKTGRHTQQFKSSLCKLFQKRMNSTLVWHLGLDNCLSPSEYGYRKLTFTLDPLMLFDKDLGKFFSIDTLLLQSLYLEKYYDTTWYYQILKEVNDLSLRSFSHQYYELLTQYKVECLH